jgi:chromosome segregation ATPase
MAPEQAHPLLKQAATLMTRDDDPLEPRAALRRAGGANEPEPGEASPGLAAELEAAKARIAEIERQAEARLAIVIEAAERRRLALEKEAQKAVKAVQDAEGRAAAALQRAEKAEATIQQAKAMPGLKGRMIRLLAGDVLK